MHRVRRIHRGSDTIPKDILFGSKDLQTVVVVDVVGGSSGCSILGMTKVTPPLPLTLLDSEDALLLVVVDDAALFLPFLATEKTFVDLSAFF